MPWRRFLRKRMNKKKCAVVSNTNNSSKDRLRKKKTVTHTKKDTLNC